MKRILALILTLALLVGLVPLSASASETVKTKTRQIHIVYDDSGSMAAGGSTSWSQAKYAMEVFAAMMGPSDTLRIYPMSSYSYVDGLGTVKCDSWGKTITISGSEGADSRVSKIDRMNGDNGIYRNTPLQAVVNAGDGLIAENADEKWLVVLTDGAFNDGSANSAVSVDEMRRTILGYAGNDGIQVAYVAIGGSAVSLMGDRGTPNFYPYDADSRNILKTVTQVATTVFNYQSVDLSGSGNYSFSADIPISRIIVFAQGESVSVGDLQVNGGNLQSRPISVAVSVDQSTPYYPKNSGYSIRFAEGLRGCVLTYEASDAKKPFPAGTYTFRSNVENVQVYFEPGVDIQAILERSDGTRINLSEDRLSSLEAGTATVRIRVVNPLTGEEILPEDSQLLEGASFFVTIQDESDNKQVLTDGESLTLRQGEISVSATARFRGDIEKTSPRKTIKITPAQLKLTFGREEYELDVPTLKPEQSIEFTVTAGDGGSLAVQELQKISFQVSATEGLSWEIQPVNDTGTYRMIPRYADKSGAAGVPLRKQSLKVDASIQAEGLSRSGSGSTRINGTAAAELKLKLNMVLPEEKFQDEDSGKRYMFDCTRLGTGGSAPYILIRAEVENGDGTTRKLTEQEWNTGLRGFSFSAEQVDANLLWRFIRLVCRQTLEFEVRKGDQVSEYKLYLTGRSSTAVLPNTSRLGVSLDISMDNGLRETGSAEGNVTVRPEDLMIYIGNLLAAILIALLVLLITILEITKHRFDKNMYPYIFVEITKSGVPRPERKDPRPSKKKVRYKWMPPWRAEERKATLSYPEYVEVPITFNCIAVGGGDFIIEDMGKKFAYYRNSVTFNGMSYDEAIQTTVVFNATSQITLQYRRGRERITVTMIFRKPEEQN